MPQPVDYCRCSCTGRRQREQRQREEWQRSWGKNLSYQDFAKPSRFTPSTFLSLSYCFSLDYFLKRLLKIKPLFACNHFLACLCATPHLLQRNTSHDITTCIQRIRNMRLNQGFYRSSRPVCGLRSALCVAMVVVHSINQSNFISIAHFI